MARSAAATVPSEEEYTTKTVERHPDVWTVEISRKPSTDAPTRRALITVGSISHLLATVETPVEE